MLWLWRFLTRGCVRCRWKTIRQVKLTNDFGESGSRYTLQCERCGRIEWKDVI